MDKNNTFTVCPVCGGKNIISTPRKWTCPDCLFDLYNNVAASVAIIIYDNERNILLLERAKEPRSGFMALPGGFVDPDESLEEAAKRECFEETHYALTSAKYLCSFPNSYEYKGVHYKTCDSFWTVCLDGKDGIKSVEQLHLQRQEKEVRRFASYPCRNSEDVEAIPLAFDSAKRALRFFTAFQTAQ